MDESKLPPRAHSQREKRVGRREPMTFEQAVRRMYIESLATEQTAKVAMKIAAKTEAKIPDGIMEIIETQSENKRVLQRLFQMMDVIPTANAEETKGDQAWFSSR